MTVDAELVTLDFALRHALLPLAKAAPLAAAMAALFAPAGGPGSLTPFAAPGRREQAP